MAECIQVGIIGAMQRAHPALTELWLDWTGIPNLRTATFDTMRTEEGGEPSTQVMLKATRYVETTRRKFCDLLGVGHDAQERRTMPIFLSMNHPAHRAFWGALKKREMTEIDGPLEWWWRLSILRRRGVRAASRALLYAVFGEDDPVFDGALVQFSNPSLKAEGRSAAEVIASSYAQPTHLHVVVRSTRKSKLEGLAFPLSDDRLKARLVATLVDQATRRKL